MSVEKDFIFDVIVNKISFDNETYYLEELIIDIKFADIDLVITSSRIDVTQFREGRSCSFRSNIEDLKKKLIENPLKITVRHFKEVVGQAVIEWPPRLIERLCEENFASHSHFEEKQLEKDGDKIGNIIIICKLQCKCAEESHPPHRDKPLADECGRLNITDELERIIDPNDVLFVIGDTPIPKFGKNALGQCGNEQCPARLDVSKYKNVKGMLVDDPAVVSPCGHLDCCAIKCCDDDCEELITDICKKLKENNRACTENLIYSTAPKFGSEDCIGEQRMCRAETHRSGCPHSTKEQNTEVRRCGCDSSSWVSESESDSESTDCERPRKAPHNPMNTMPHLDECTATRPKYCPICGEDISWLSKFAACVKCGYKPMLYEYEEKKYDETLTADEILSKWCAEVGSLRDDGNKKKEKINRCSCKDERKLCAFCRIRKITRDIICEDKKSKTCYGDETPEFTATDGEVDDNASNICEKTVGICLKNEIPNLTKTLEDLKAKYGAGVKKKGKLYEDHYMHSKFDKFREFCEKKLNTEKGKSSNKKTNTKLVRKKSSNVKTSASNGSTKHRKKETTSDKGTMSVCFEQKLSKHCDCVPKNKKVKKKSRLYSLFKSKRTISERHTACIGEGMPVPKNMGWLWTESEPAKKGWTPGAISKPIKVLMTHFLKDFPTDNLGVSKYHGRTPTTAKCEENKLIQRPTLHITKKHGEYLITMRPLKDPKQLEESADPYAKVKPIQFKICKNPIMLYKRNIKRILKERGFRKCCCGQPIACCSCRTYEEKGRLECEVARICQKYCIENLSTTLVLSDTTDSDSELDVEFTPPVGLVKPFLKKQPDSACQETQYAEKDYEIKQFIKKRDRLQKPYVCDDRGRGDDSDEDKNKKKNKGPLAAADARKKKGKDIKKGKGKDDKDGKGGKGKDGKKKNRCRLPAKYTGKPQFGRKTWPSLGDPPPLICMEKHMRHAEYPAYPCPSYPCPTYPCSAPYAYNCWNPSCC